MRTVTLFLAAATALAGATAAANAYETVRPPAVLSPDLAQPWLVPTSAEWRARLPIIYVDPRSILTFAEFFRRHPAVYPRLAPPPGPHPVILRIP